VLTAYFREEVLHILETGREDVVLLDVMMPSLDGFEVCSVGGSRAQRKRLRMPVIMVIALDQTCDKVKGAPGGRR
jgi:DNA-binding response OmpR family regulator